MWLSPGAVCRCCKRLQGDNESGGGELISYDTARISMQHVEWRLPSKDRLSLFNKHVLLFANLLTTPWEALCEKIACSSPFALYIVVLIV